MNDIEAAAVDDAFYKRWCSMAHLPNESQSDARRWFRAGAALAHATRGGHPAPRDGRGVQPRREGGAMSEPERIPEWARDEAGRIALSSEDRDADIIADTAERSLMEAYRRGREDAAKCCDRRAALRIGGDEDPMARAMNRLASAEAAECAREIRAGGA